MEVTTKRPRKKTVRPKIGRYKGVDQGAVVELFKSGLNAMEIGRQMGMADKTARRIIADHGIDYAGEMKRRLEEKRAALQAKKALIRPNTNEKRANSTYGCTYEQLVAIVGPVKPFQTRAAEAYRNQRNAAKSRGIEFRMTFPEWWQVWQDSGKWELRGRGQGYCMARNLDAGPYAVGNVYICTIGQNFSDSYLSTPMDVRVARRGMPKPPRQPKERGVTRTGKKYRANCRGVFLGTFATEEEAREAYKRAWEITL